MPGRTLVLCLSAVLAGCAVGPNYKRPDLPVPPTFRSGEPNPSKRSIGNEKWFDLFQDPVLRDLIREGLINNYDILIAEQRVVEGEGRLAAPRAALFPHLDGETSASRIGIHSPTQSVGEVFAIATWELDLFGKFRRATQAARADLMALQENQETIIQALIAQLASAYFDLLEYDLELRIVGESIKTRRESVRLVAARVEGGVASMLDLDQANSLVESAQSDAVVLERAQTQTENLIAYLVGRSPGPIVRGKTLVEQSTPVEIPDRKSV